MNVLSTNQPNNDNLKFEFADKPSKDLLRELIVYIAGQCSEDAAFGATKLNKILYFADFLAYARYGEPITGTPYIRLAKGPVPEYMSAVRSQMEADKDIAIVRRDFFGFEQHRIIALRDANLDKLSSRDIAMVDRVIQLLEGRNASQVSYLSHGRAWKVAEDGQRIPYNAVFISDEGITEEDRTLTRELFPQYSDPVN